MTSPLEIGPGRDELHRLDEATVQEIATRHRLKLVKTPHGFTVFSPGIRAVVGGSDGKLTLEDALAVILTSSFV